MNICKKLFAVIFLVSCVVGLNAQEVPCPDAPPGWECGDPYDIYPELDFTNIPATINTGDIICLDLDVTNFIAIASLSFTISFDPNVIQWSSTDFSTSELPSSASFIHSIAQVDNGNYGLLYTDGQGRGVCLADGSTLISICFEVVGACGDSSPLLLTENVTEIEAGINFDVADFVCALDTILFNQAGLGIAIDCDECTINASSCATNGTDGCLTFSIGGGAAPYDINIPGIGLITGFEEGQDTTICGLAPGAISITVMDSDGTIHSEVVPIQFGDPLDFDLEVSPTACDYICNGQVKIVNINRPDYTVEWSNFVFNTDSIGSLCNGSYSVTVTDLDGCKVVEEITLETVPIDVVIDIVQEPSCPGSIDGILCVTPFGGTPFTPGSLYEINGPLRDKLTDNFVKSGDYDIRIRDANGCVLDTTIDVNAGGELDFIFDVFRHDCGEGYGQVRISTYNTDGGVADHPLFKLYDEDYNLVVPGGINSLNNFIYDDIPPGFYNLTVREDMTGCLDTISFEVLTSPELVITENFSGPDCDGNGAFAEVIVTGGTPAISYKWDGGEETSKIENITPGMYTVTITDNLLCDSIVEFEIPDVDALIIQTTNSSIDCDGTGVGGTLEVTILSGGNNLDIEWIDVDGNVVGNTAIVNNVPAGFYTVKVTDNDSSCFKEATATISNSGTLDVQVITNPPTCPDGGDGSINLIVSGGSGMGYMMEWNHPNGIATNFILPALPCGTYEGISVRDSDGCTVNLGTVEVPCPDRLEVEVNLTKDVSCFGEANGEALAEIVGGTQLYDFVWSSGESGFGTFGNATMLLEGENWVIASDGLCSSDTIFFEIGTVDVISVSSDGTTLVSASCFGINDGQATITATGGFAPNGNYSYNWLTDGSVGNTNSNLTAGYHYVEITDESTPGCTILDSVFISQPDSLIVEIDSFVTFNLGCPDDNTGMIGLNITGGNIGDLNYSWTNAVSDSMMAVNLGVGTFCVTVTDVQGCSDQACYEVTAPDPVSFDLITPEEPDCFGGSTCIEVENVRGGSGINYKFGVNNSLPVSIDSCIEVQAGITNVVVFDDGGCSSMQTIEVTQPAPILVDLGPDITIDLGDTTTILNVGIEAQDPIDSINWDPFMFLTCKTDNCSVVSVNPDRNITYGVTVYDINGCMGFDDINVSVKPDRNVFISNIFSPNGDGQNDEFKINTGRGVEDIESFSIFDRWGNRVFDAGSSRAAGPDGSEAWDGTHNGRVAQPGVYIYLARITFVDGYEFTYKGSVTLVR